ncbi:hypothetical protein RDI58_011088 [Solanum bulbocastanum]|uniref:Uncharacterized protein n=1 Tax=Solanum bulbocastanum TaxID=147425 RepID=A0AAN8TVN1_SOLBU
MELEKQGNMDLHSAAQQMAPHQFGTNNWISPFSSTIQSSLYQDSVDKGKRVAHSSSNYTYTPSSASSLQLRNMPFSQNSSPFTPLQAQLTFGESSDNSLTNFWHNICTSTRHVSSPLANTDTQLNTPSQLGLEYAHSNWNINLNNNNNINHTDQSSIQSDVIASNVNGFNFPMEENTMGNKEYFAEKTHEIDAGEWDDVFLNEAFNGDDF